MGLPLRMDNLHAPTVASGPNSGASGEPTRGEQLSFSELEQRKGNIEAELKALGSVLDSHKVDMNTSLLTSDGFPRSDIDVAQIRTTRSRIVRLRNDYKGLMATIEKFLHGHFAATDQNNSQMPAESQAQLQPLPDSQPEQLVPPFAKVNTVAANSPAEQAGLKAGDLIRIFGYVDRHNHDNLKKIAECVQGNEGSSIFIKISRPTNAAQGQELRLALTPKSDWGGRGMLGCHIVPL